MRHQKGRWENTDEVIGVSYICGYCNTQVGPTEVYKSTLNYTIYGHIYICPNCNKPTYEDAHMIRYPNVKKGSKVSYLESNVENLYNEARNCISVNAFTSAVLACRKLLMSIAVDKGAAGSLKFIEYVDYLNENHYVPPGSKEWVDHIRNKGNEATHEIPEMTSDDAVEILEFTENLLRIIYEMPGKMKKHHNKS